MFYKSSVCHIEMSQSEPFLAGEHLNIHRLFLRVRQKGIGHKLDAETMDATALLVEILRIDRRVGDHP